MWWDHLRPNRRGHLKFHTYEQWRIGLPQVEEVEYPSIPIGSADLVTGSGDKGQQISHGFGPVYGNVVLEHAANGASDTSCRHRGNGSPVKSPTESLPHHCNWHGELQSELGKSARSVKRAGALEDADINGGTRPKLYRAKNFSLNVRGYRRCHSEDYCMELLSSKNGVRAYMKRASM